MTTDQLRNVLNSVRNPCGPLANAALPSDAGELLALWSLLQREGVVGDPDRFSAARAQAWARNLARDDAGVAMFAFVDRLLRAILQAVPKQDPARRTVILASELEGVAVPIGGDAGLFHGFHGAPLSHFPAAHPIHAAIGENAYLSRDGVPLLVFARPPFPHWIGMDAIAEKTRSARRNQLEEIALHQRAEQHRKQAWEVDANSDPTRLRAEIERLKTQQAHSGATTG